MSAVLSKAATRRPVLQHETLLETGRKTLWFDEKSACTLQPFTVKLWLKDERGHDCWYIFIQNQLTLSVSELEHANLDLILMWVDWSSYIDRLCLDLSF